MDRGDYLASLIKKNNFKYIAEIGVWKGKTAYKILNKNEQIIKYFLIDPWQEYEEYTATNDPRSRGDFYEAFITCKQKLANFENKTVWIKKKSNEAVNLIPDQSLDLVFIDGNHSYEFVYNDIINWIPKIKNNGIISGHDLDYPGYPGVRKAVEAHFGKSFNIGEDFVWWKRLERI